MSLFAKDSLLDNAVAAAVRDGIVILAASAAEGYNAEGCFPADLNGVIKIAAATDHGETRPKSLRRNADFLFPGENVVAAATASLGTITTASPASPDDNDDSGGEEGGTGKPGPWPCEVSGPSVATAVATGVASLVLACHRLALAVEGDDRRWEHEAARRRRYVNTLFSRMAGSGGRYVRPWTIFHDEDSRQSWGEAGSILEWVHGKFLETE